MLKTTIVAWLVVLVVALTVVTFITRIIEKCRPRRRFRHHGIRHRDSL
jgi:hypothetical protein